MRLLVPMILLAAAPALGAPPSDVPPSPASQPSASRVAGAPLVPAQALVEKLGQGDRLFLAGDYRNALFAYQDAVYLDGQYAPARVKLGRTYLALRYAPQALTQAEAALAADPDSADARKLVEDARSAPARLAPAAAPQALAPAPPARPGPRVYRFTPEADAPAAPGERVAIIERVPAGETPPVAASAPEPLAAQRYRAGVAQLENREWAKAALELTEALAADPKLAVAHSARGSALFGLGRYREAEDDYRAAAALDPKLAMPLYGLAECHRVLGETKAAVEMYRRYADSLGSDVREDLRAIAMKQAQDLH